MKGIFIFIGKKNRQAKVAYTCLLSILFQLFYPLHTYALTSGPSQEEYASFEPFETNQMVDPYSGDFTYNLPLLSVPGPNGGYPVNLSYHSGISMDQEASWVGLGWNINVGAITRGLRGLPDDMNGQQVTQQAHIKDYYTTNLSLPYVKKKEYFGLEGSNGTVATQLYYNNYKGVGYRLSYNANFKVFSNNANAGFGLSYDSQGGIGISPQISAGEQYRDAGYSVGLSANINSRSGLTSYALSSSATLNETKISSDGNAGMRGANYAFSSSLSFPFRFYTPQVAIPTEGKRINFDFKFPIKFLGGSVSILPYTTKSLQFLWYEGMYEEEKIANGGSFSHAGYGYLHASNQSGALNDFERKEISYSKKIPNISPTAFTYDVFSVSGQGVGGMFRGYRNDVGILFDPEVQNQKQIKNLNLETGFDIQPSAGVDLRFHMGFDNAMGVNQDITTKGQWSSGLNLNQGFTSGTTGSNTRKALYEEAYFQMYGEKTAVYDNENILSSTGGGWGSDYPVRAKLYKNGSDYEVDGAQNFVYSQNGSQVTFPNPAASMPNRKRRANNIEYLSTSQAKEYGVTKTGAYTYSVQGGSSVDKYTGVPGDLSDQLSEIVIRQTDGSRYVYGLPAYNKTQMDATFRVDYGGTHQPVSASDMCSSNACGSNEAQTRYISTKFGSGANTGGITHAKQTTGANGYTAALDEYVSKTSKPAYAHSWLMTHLLGSDYIDSDGTPGPSAGDYGYWVKFNYKKITGNYQWRIPFHDAAYSPNSISNPKDNMANYSYGQKDIYVLESIETKTHKAIFYTTARHDGYEANGEMNSVTNSGGLGQVRGTQTLYKLDSICLFTQAALLSSTPSDKRPLQTVHMDYDYSLCQGIPNNKDMTACDNSSTTKGKLTLKSLYFTYNGSQRGKLSKYQFNYGEYTDYNGDPAVSNPRYNPFMVDRWGNYAQYQYSYPFSGVYSIADYNGNLPLSNIPYTSQTVPPDAYAWNLTSISTPGGGKIKVEYEPDDYAYVQDKPAMQMLNIRGAYKTLSTSNILSTTIVPKVFNSGNCNGDATQDIGFSNIASMESAPGANNSIIYFDLEKSVPNTATAADFQKMYLNNIQDGKVFFKACTSVNRDDLGTEREYENISGYADLDMTSGSYGFASSGASSSFYDLGFISLKNEKMSKYNNKYIHPFQLAAINYVRMNRPENIYESTVSASMTSNGFAIANVGSLLSFIPDIAKNIQSFNKFAAKKGIGNELKFNGHSMIRLSSPDEKYGGGVRVKRIYIEDNFKTSTANVYGQEYEYKTEENGVKVSSGVAYEPQVGGEESALRSPVDYPESNLLQSPVTLFLENPILEQFFPGPSVGYRKVTVKSIARANAEAPSGSSANYESLCEAQPATIYEYYTPKDFPVYYDQTNLTGDAPIKKGFPPIPGLPGSMKHVLARSQGYMIALNDMAGKLRSVTSITPAKNVSGQISYSQGKILHKEVYNYKTTLPYNASGTNKLDNNVIVMDETGCFKNAKIGETADVYIDANEDKNESEEFYLNWNVGLGIDYTPPAAVAIIPIPLPIPKKNSSLIKYKSIVTMKVINRTGILASAEIYDGQAYNKKENLVYDSQTGEPVYTKVKNEFSDDVYSMSYPAHLYYGRMDGAYKTHNALVKLSDWSITPTLNSAKELSFSDNALTGIFNIGDRILVNGIAVYYVADKGTNGTTNFIKCIDASGNYISSISGLSTIQIIESGFKNRQSSSAGSVTTLKTAPYAITPGSSCITGLAGMSLVTNPRGGENCYAFNSVSIPNVLNASAIAYSDDWKTAGTNANLSSNVPYPSTSYTGGAINPFTQGLKGIWRPVQQYNFMAKRKQNNYSRNDGTFDFVPFVWNDNLFVSFMNGDLTNTCAPATKPNWYLFNTITKVSPYGYEIENRDADGIFSSALYGYKQQLVKATAANAQYRDMLFDGFEDYLNGYGYAANENHWQFTNTSNISTQFAHTGRYSVKIASGVSTPLEVKVPINIDATPAAKFYYSQPNYSFGTGGVVSNYNTYNDVFSPRVGSDYELSCWVKENNSSSSAYYTDKAYKNPQVSVEFYSTAGALIGTALAANPYLQTDARIIEGWQRLVFPFSVPVGAASMKFKFSNQNTNTGSDVYFDDFRAYPAKSYIKSFVYDPITLRYSATLDENNYATFYVYDDEGKLVITKKETREGVKTISEGRSGNKQ